MYGTSRGLATRLIPQAASIRLQVPSQDRALRAMLSAVDSVLAAVLCCPFDEHDLDHGKQHHANEQDAWQLWGICCSTFNAVQRASATEEW